MLKKFINIMFLSCCEATLLMEKRSAEDISPKENFRLSLHIRMCKWCRIYQEKLEILDGILKRKLFQDGKTNINQYDIQLLKDKIVKNLNI